MACAVGGLWSTLWGPDQFAEYQAMVKRLYTKGSTLDTDGITVNPETPAPVTPVLMAIDRSGSMWGVASDVRGGFNAYVEGLAADHLNKYTVTLYLFNDQVEATVIAAAPADVPQLTEENYQAHGATALFDAIGDLVSGYKAKEGERPLVVIHTDGLENASAEWKMKSLAALIEAKKEAGWGFVFLGADIDAWQGERLGMFSGQTVNSRAGNAGTYSGLTMGTVAYASGASAQSVTQTAAETSVEWDKRERTDGK